MIHIHMLLHPHGVSTYLSKTHGVLIVVRRWRSTKNGGERERVNGVKREGEQTT